MSADARCWYLNQKGKAAGPFTFEDLRRMASMGQLRGHDLVFKDGGQEWKRAYDWPQLAVELFSDDDHALLSRLIKLPDEVKAIDNQWVLLVREEVGSEVKFRQKGPYGTEEIQRLILGETVKNSDHVWKKGLTRWVPLHEIPEFSVRNLKITNEAAQALDNVETMPELEERPIEMARVEGVASKAQIYKPEASSSAVPIQPMMVRDHSVDRPVDKPAIVSPAAIEVQRPVKPEFKTEVKPAKVEIKEEVKAVPVEIKEAASEPLAMKPSKKPNTKPEAPWLDRLAPAFAVMIVGVFALGFWATLNTDRSALQRPNPKSFAENTPPAPVMEDSAVKLQQPAPPVAEIPNALPVAKKPAAAQSQVSAPVAQVEAAQPVSVPAPAPIEEKGPAVRVNAENTQLEILAPFKQSDLLRIRIEGKVGQILDLPALVQKYEVKAAKNGIHTIPLSSVRLPKGEYQVTLQFGVSRIVRRFVYGKDSENFQDQLQAHRKAMSYDQQQEKKRLLKATKDLADLLEKAETQIQTAASIKSALRDFEKKTPKELKQIRMNRYQLSYAEAWEKLAIQWSKAEDTLKDSSQRNPASLSNFKKARRAANTLQSEVRNITIWE